MGVYRLVSGDAHRAADVYRFKTANQFTGVYCLVSGCSASTRQIELRVSTVWSRGMLSIKMGRTAILSGGVGGPVGALKVLVVMFVFAGV